ncbi:alpha/beta hydrolase family protein [Kribbella sp. NPDC056345]|uniref:alpha/beta hydrolase family protein n=1 Tax=Kribbella sp. NPDC056345 TaxID=3345789 RepID=UPI0035E20E40
MTALTFDVPAPTGPDRTGTSALHLADGQRELMVSVWYPAGAEADGEVARYMPPKQALAWDEDLRLSADLGGAPGFVDLAKVRTHSLIDVPVRPGVHPVVLFSPGYYHSRFQNTAQLEELASHGYVVVAIDHTHETPVEFPGGRLVPGTGEPIATTPAYRSAIASRVADTRFVLDQLATFRAGVEVDADGKLLPPGLGVALGLEHIGMFGFSAGGFTTASAMLVDPRIAAGADLDGPLADDKIESPTSEVSERGLDRPFLLFGSGDDDLSWAQFSKSHRSWKLNLQLPGATHNAFTDLQYIYADLLRQLVPNDPDLRQVALSRTIGTVDPQRSILAQRTYLTAYFNKFLRLDPAPLLNAPSPDYPEVTFV